jgi:hypothetical protein
MVAAANWSRESIKTSIRVIPPFNINNDYAFLPTSSAALSSLFTSDVLNNNDYCA